MRCTDHSTPRTQFLELLVNSFINMDDPWAAVSQDDIVVFGSLWGTLLGPLGLYKCTWQHNSTSYSFHFHSDSTDVKQCCTCWVVFVVFLFLVLVVFSVFFFFFWNSATCFFAVMFQHSLLEGFSGLEVCCQDMYYMGLEVMNVKISLKKKKKKWISNQGDPPRPELPPKKSGWQLMSRKTLVMAQNHLYEHHADNAYMQHDAQKVYPSILTLSLMSNHTRTEPPYVFSSKLLLIVLQMALNQALDCIWILPATKSQPGSQNIPIWTLPPTSLGSFWSKIRQGFAGLMWCFIRNAWPCHADGASLMFYRILGALSQAIALQLLGEKAVCCVLAGISPC